MDTALRLADLVSEAEGPLATGGAGQLVHGDFWDNNVYFRSEKLVAVTDLDFMGKRPRIDDLALTHYFTDEEKCNWLTPLTGPPRSASPPCGHSWEPTPRR
jgi:Ser/Thr protein kinase RdoA (MazF antagonist)